VSGQLHAPAALLPWNWPTVPRVGLDAKAKRKPSCHCTDSCPGCELGMFANWIQRDLGCSDGIGRRVAILRQRSLWLKCYVGSKVY
jgi:hypothetical protein